MEKKGLVTRFNNISFDNREHSAETDLEYIGTGVRENPQVVAMAQTFQ